MSPENYQRASDLFNELHDLPAEDREVMLERACEGNDDLLAEVQRLLQAEQGSCDFLEKGALADTARLLQPHADETRAPETIAHYRILSKLGEGGMGEVWRAHDTKLDRQVAIKILAEAFAGNPDRMARFSREAQVLAALNHPNIAVIYGVEERALIMELIDGPTLAECTASGLIPWKEAAEIACHIADALEAAHEKGNKIHAGAPHHLFDTVLQEVGARNKWVVTADGQEFMAVVPVDEKPVYCYKVILNWPSLLRKP